MCACVRTCICTYVCVLAIVDCALQVQPIPVCKSSHTVCALGGGGHTLSGCLTCCLSVGLSVCVVVCSHCQSVWTSC